MELEFLNEFLSFPQLQFLPLTTLAKPFSQFWSNPSNSSKSRVRSNSSKISTISYRSDQNLTHKPKPNTSYRSKPIGTLQTQTQQTRHHFIPIITHKPKTNNHATTSSWSEPANRNPTNAIHPNWRWVSVGNERYGTKQSERTTSMMSFSLGGPIWALI